MFVKSHSKTIPLLVTGSLLFGAAQLAVADGDDHEEEHFDIAVWNDGGNLVTGGWDHDTEELEVANLRVFEATMGEDPLFPFATDEPGIGGVASDLGLMVGSTLTFNIFSGLGTWNGSGFDYGTGAAMTIDYGPTSVSTLTGGSLDFLVTEDYDLHPIWSLADTTPNGAYLMEITADMAGFSTTESFYVVFNLGLDEEDYEASVEWVEANLVPAPGALALLGLFGATACRRRQR
jgi:hypothetical protein